MSIPPRFILYTSKRYQLAFSTNIKYGISSSHVKFVPYKVFHKKQQILLNKINNKSLHSLNYTLPNTKFNSNFIPFLTSKSPSLKKISLDFGKERVLFTTFKGHQLLLRKLFSHCKTLSTVNITLNGSDRRDISILKSLCTIKSLQKLDFKLRFYRESMIKSFVDNLNKFMTTMHKRKNWHFLRSADLNAQLLPEVFQDTSEPASLNCLNLYLGSSQNKLDLLFYFLHCQDPNSLNNIAERLENVPRLESLALGSPTGLELSCFLPILEKLRDLRSVNFYFAGPNAYQALSILPKAMPEWIIQLDLRLDKLKEMGKNEDFLRELGGMKQLKRLKLLFFVQNSLGDSTLGVMGESISQLKNLEILHLGCQKQNYEGNVSIGIGKIFEAVGTLENLRDMSLGFRHYHHYLDDQVVGKLCVSLKKMRNLEILILDLSSSEIGNVGVIELGKSVKRMKGLRRLHLDVGGGVWMSPEVLMRLNEYIGRLKILSELVLKVRYERIEAEMALSYVEMVLKLKELSYMDLCFDRNSMENDDILIMLQGSMKHLQKRIKIDFSWPILA